MRPTNPAPASATSSATAATAGHTAARRPWHETLRAVREARGATQEGWAARLGVSRKTVQRWERGERPPDPGAEAAILAYCRQAGLLRAFDRGPLAGLTLTEAGLHDLFAEARWRGGGREARARPPTSAPETATGGQEATAQLDPGAALDALAGSESETPGAAGEAPPALPAPPPPPTNLPVALTSFVGRESELAAVRRVQAGTRLLTLTGPGGGGKTRLALVLAGEVRWAYPDGVWCVDLASLADPALVAQSVVTALGLRPTGPQPLVETLAATLRPRHLLLVLDNCEHLLPACATLVEALLRACPHLEVVATSRESLGIGGETVWRVPPLALPEEEQGAGNAGQQLIEGENGAGDLAALLSSDAVRLFVERARLQRPDFALTTDNAASVAAICRRLDGMPLAIELAAARLKVLSIGQIEERLRDRFQLLTGGGRTALPRHQTLRATLDWSYDLLATPERSLFRRLTVFVGGFTLEAAEAVCGDEDEEPFGSAQGRLRTKDETAPSLRPSFLVFRRGDILDLLSQLVDKSLVLVEERGGEARYRLLETVREYGREALMASGEVEATRGRHAAFYLLLVEHIERRLLGAEQAVWLDRLERDHDNLRSALDWYLAHDHEAGLRLATALRRFWYVRGYFAEGRRWLDALMARAPQPTRLRSRSLYILAELARLEGDYDRARTLFEAALAIHRALGEEPFVAWTLDNLGLIATLRGEYDRAGELLEAALAIFRRLGHRRAIAWVLDDLANLARLRGGYDRARRLFNESLHILREIQDPWGIPWVLYDLANLARLEADDQARAFLGQALRRFQEMGEQRGIAGGLSLAGVLDGQCGAHCRGVRLIAAGAALHRRLGTTPQPDEQMACDASLAAARAALGERAFAAAWAEGDALAPEQAVASALSTERLDSPAPDY